MNWRTPVAKAVYWVGGMLSKVKYPQPSYTIKWDEWTEYDYDDPPWRMVRNPGRTWQSVGWAWDLLGWSEIIDPEHWEHWALVWDFGDRCDWCGGVDREQQDWDELPVTPDSVTGDTC